MSDSVWPHRRQPPGSPVPGILQARTLEWVAISFSSAWKWKVKAKSLSRVWLLATPRTAAYQVPPPMGFSRQEYWNGVPLPSPRNSIESAQKWRHRSTEHTGEPNINPCAYGQLSYKKERICGGKNTAPLINGVGKLDSYVRKNETGPLSHTIYKIRSKWIKDLKVRPKSVKFLKEDTQAGCCSTWVLAIIFWLCLLRQGKQKQI